MRKLAQCGESAPLGFEEEVVDKRLTGHELHHVLQVGVQQHVQRDAGRQSQRAGAAPQHEEHLHGDDQQPGLWEKQINITDIV